MSKPYKQFFHGNGITKTTHGQKPMKWIPDSYLDTYNAETGMFRSRRNLELMVGHTRIWIQQIIINPMIIYIVFTWVKDLRIVNRIKQKRKSLIKLKRKGDFYND